MNLLRWLPNTKVCRWKYGASGALLHLTLNFPQSTKRCLITKKKYKRFLRTPADSHSSSTNLRVVLLLYKQEKEIRIYKLRAKKEWVEGEKNIPASRQLCSLFRSVPEHGVTDVERVPPSSIQRTPTRRQRGTLSDKIRQTPVPSILVNSLHHQWHTLNLCQNTLTYRFAITCE